tara:strand:- start:79 stop:405 length:327 start_codon:yes stop_codon:yes gene_type:complete
VSNKSGIPRAEIVAIVDGGHKWSIKESMQDFIKSGGLFEEWGRTFSIVKITDKSLSDILFLNDTYDDVVSKWLFVEPATSTEEWQDLYLTGEVERPWSIVNQYLVERR